MGSGYEIARGIQRCVAAGRLERDCWNSTPRQLGAWLELIAREEMRRDNVLMGVMRAAQHADKQGYLEFSKKLREHGA